MASALTRMYRKNGEVVDVHNIDARQAVAAFPDEWSLEPWPVEAPAPAPAPAGKQTKIADAAAEK